jgi:hypothetical protein
MFIFHCHIEVMGQLKYYILSIHFVCELNLVSKHCSEYQIQLSQFYMPRHRDDNSESVNKNTACFYVFICVVLCCVALCVLTWPRDMVTYNFRQWGLCLPPCSSHIRGSQFTRCHKPHRLKCCVVSERHFDATNRKPVCLRGLRFKTWVFLRNDIPAFYSRGTQFGFRPGSGYRDRNFLCLHHFTQADDGITPWNRPRLPLQKCKCKVVPVFNQSPSNEDGRGSGGIAPRILNLGSRWKWVVSITLGHFTRRKTAPDTHCIGGWVGPRAGLDTVE